MIIFGPIIIVLLVLIFLCMFRPVRFVVGYALIGTLAFLAFEAVQSEVRRQPITATDILTLPPQGPHGRPDSYHYP